MKTCHDLFVGIGLLILCSVSLTACVNHISEEEGEIINNGDIPLKFVADIHEIVNTRVANNNVPLYFFNGCTQHDMRNRTIRLITVTRILCNTN